MVDVSIESFPAVAQGDDRPNVAGYLDFKVSVAVADSGATVRIRGELDCHTAPQLEAALLRLVEGGAPQVIVDMRSVHFVDSTGLSVLVGGMKRLRDRGGSMVVRSPTQATRKLFEITGLNTVLDVS